MPNVPQYFSELPAEGRQQVERGMETLARFLDSGKRQMKSYQAGDSTVFKLINDLRYTSAMAAAMVDELIERHEIPDAGKLRNISEELRSDMRDTLARKPDGR